MKEATERVVSPPGAIAPSALAELSPAPASFLSRLWPVSGAAQDIASLDGIRAIALLLTVFDHLLLSSFFTPHVDQADLGFLRQTKPWWENARSGVQLFFVLSGFLLFIPYARTLLGLKPFPSTRKYYARRALRIMPAYWISLVAIGLFFAPYHFGADPAVDFGLHALMLHGWSTTTFFSINSPYWTMAVEAHFYLLLPWLAHLLISITRSPRVRTPAFLALGCFLLAGHPLLMFVFERSGALRDHRTIVEVFQHLSAFSVGMACSVLYTAMTEQKDPPISPARLAYLARIAGVLGLTGIFVYFLAAGVPPLR
ncbi:MAG TPA: acyltransferase, partial [Polyangiaceae bacterium]|nr:acyltransferase [Polyangiaceae bacterium]